MPKLNSLFKAKKLLIGMVHLPPLPGYSTHPGMGAVIEKALKDLDSLQKAGFSGALVENDSDQPHKIGVKPHIRKAFTEVMGVVINHAKIPIGMEIIYDMKATVEVAARVNASFVRLDVFVDSVQTKWGKIKAQASELATLRNKLKKDLLFFTDIHVKHATLLEQKTLEQSTQEAIEHGSDCVIVTGIWTRKPPTKEDCKQVKAVAGTVPVFIGSGLNAENITSLIPLVDGGIVGTGIKSGEYIDFRKAKKLARLLKLLISRD